MNKNLTADVTAGFTHVFGHYSSDVLIIIILFAALFLYGLFAGKTKLVSLIMSLYVGSIAFFAFPFTSNITIIRNIPNAGLWSALIVFILLTVITHLIMNKIVLTSESFGKTRYIHYSILALSGLMAIVGLFYTILPFGRLFAFSPELKALIDLPLVLFIFILLPLVFIYTSNRY